MKSETKRPGRPKSENPLNNVVPLRLTTAQLAALTKAAKATDQTNAEWVREVVLQALDLK